MCRTWDLPPLGTATTRSIATLARITGTTLQVRNGFFPGRNPFVADRHDNFFVLIVGFSVDIIAAHDGHFGIVNVALIFTDHRFLGPSSRSPSTAARTPWAATFGFFLGLFFRFADRRRQLFFLDFGLIRVLGRLTHFGQFPTGFVAPRATSSSATTATTRLFAGRFFRVTAGRFRNRRLFDDAILFKQITHEFVDRSSRLTGRSSGTPTAWRTWPFLGRLRSSILFVQPGAESIFGS